MNFPFNVYLLAFASAALTAAVSLPLWRAWCVRTGHVDDPGHRKIHTEAVPLAGGLAVLTGIAVPLLVAWITLQLGAIGPASGLPLAHGVGRRAGQLAAIILGALGIVALGWLDDRLELRPLPKFLGQLVVAAVVAAAGVRVTLFVPSVGFSYVVTVLWLMTVINAFNFMDNMNGLCAGLGAIAAFVFAVHAAVGGQYLVTLLALLTCGALVGFLPYNFPNARAFLGDAGSHLVGYLLAVLAILPTFHSAAQPRPWAVLTPLVVLGVPLADLVQVVWRRWRRGQPVYVGDTSHVSHELARRVGSPVRAVLLLWLAAAFLGALATWW